MIVKTLLRFSCILPFVICAFSYPQVKVSEGILEGIPFVTEDGRIAHKFLGIPFASPPIGDLRFKAPQSPSSWNGIRPAKEFASICKSYSSQSNSTDEDCLYLNVYTPHLNDTNLLYPVMVYISGGGFQNCVREYPSSWLITEDIVLVTIGYRVGVFGFLSLDIEEAPGNAGLKDQVAALKWLKKNIASFGGDPDDIMVFGQSAGSASVNYLLISDMTKGLFHRVAMMSGSALNPLAYGNKHKEFGMKLSDKLGCSTQSESEALQCLLSKSADELLHAVGKPAPSNAMADENMYFQELVFLPSIEKKFDEQEAFLTESASSRMKSGKFHKIPIMAGFTDAEAINKVNDTLIDPVLYGLININFERYVPREMCLENGSKESLDTADLIKQFYYGEDPIEVNVDNYITIKSDTGYKRGINDMVKLLANKSCQPIYYYKFSFYDPDLRRATKLMFYEGASHHDDIYFLFYSKSTQTDILPRYKPEVEITRKRMVKLYTNFAKYGNPTPEPSELLPLKWEPVSRNKLNFLSIDKDLWLSTNPDRENMEFWENLVKSSRCSLE